MGRCVYGRTSNFHTGQKEYAQVIIKVVNSQVKK